MKLLKMSMQELDQYQRDGYFLACSAVSTELIGLARTILERWVDSTIDGWLTNGLLDDRLQNVDFSQRLARAWNAAGRPTYCRSPRRDLVSREMFEFLSHPLLLDLAEDLLGTPEISVHGIFNARPKLPDQSWTDTPWHQDAQYFRDGADVHIVTMWIPLQRVTEQNSCLQVAPDLHRGRLHENYEDRETGFIGLMPAVQQTLTGLSIPMNPGDVLCFTQKTPHRALPNLSDTVRWSMDVRYEATPTATASGRKQGFIARSHLNPRSVETYEQWMVRWASIPAGSH